jgi:hypothetical protein
MTPPTPAADPEAAAQQLEQLLARSIGPMAKIVLARARKRAADDTALLKTLADSIDDEAERATFVTAAARVVESLSRSGGTGKLVSGVAPVAPPAPPFATNVASPPAPASDLPPLSAPRDDGAMKPGAIFVSYARDNLPVARRIVEALRNAGLEVWLDMGKLQPGDQWDLKIRRNIEACSFFVALISRETDARPEGYFRREWNIAADRALNFADDVPFLLPVTIDNTAAYTARVPERFRASHWTALPDGSATPEFVDHLKQLVDDYRRRHGA